MSRKHPRLVQPVPQVAPPIGRTHEMALIELSEITQEQLRDLDRANPEALANLVARLIHSGYCRKPQNYL